jgi:DNA damage-binding protein 1
LTDRKSISLGTTPLKLRKFTSNATPFVFCSSDRPTVIYSRLNKLLYSNVNLRHVSGVSPFNTSMSENGLAIATEGELRIGAVETVQKLHVKSIHIGETVRRIAYHEECETFGIVTNRQVTSNTGIMEELSYFKILHGKTFEVLASHELERYELASSLGCVALGGKTYFVVGTGFAFPSEDEPNRGRILLFSVTSSRRMQLEYSLDINGCAYAVEGVHGKLVAAINSKVVLLNWNAALGALETLYTHHGHVMALQLSIRGDFIVVGDLMKSITVLSYNAETEKLVELSRDFENNWMTAVEAVDDDTFIGADNSYNLFSVVKRADAGTEEDAKRLTSNGAYHLGDLVNRFRNGWNG